MRTCYRAAPCFPGFPLGRNFQWAPLPFPGRAPQVLEQNAHPALPRAPSVSPLWLFFCLGTQTHYYNHPSNPSLCLFLLFPLSLALWHSWLENCHSSFARPCLVLSDLYFKLPPGPSNSERHPALPLLPGKGMSHSDSHPVGLGHLLVLFSVSCGRLYRRRDLPVLLQGNS